MVFSIMPEKEEQDPFFEYMTRDFIGENHAGQPDGRISPLTLPPAACPHIPNPETADYSDDELHAEIPPITHPESVVDNATLLGNQDQSICCCCTIS